MAQDPNSLGPVSFQCAKDFFAWQKSLANPLTFATVPRAPRAKSSPVQLLVGLDNGPWTYWDQFDAYAQGGPRGNVYNFQEWQYVDAIYYYVHQIVAVPPPVWTNAAHRNGVRMYSAVTQDVRDKKDQFTYIFDQPDVAAQQLYDLATTYGFDGWMFDAEGDLDDDLAARVQKVMSILKDKTLPNGDPFGVGYYQAYQTTLNQETYPFFEAGRFYQGDYSGSPGDPQATYKWLEERGKVDERFNTFWALYTYNYRYPPGLNNGFQVLNVNAFFGALAAARKTPPPYADYYQSLGIYGPDWTMYGGHDDKSDPLPDRETFHNTERLFWVGDKPTFNPDGTLTTTAPAVSNFIPARTSIVSTPFVTRFNTGEGSFFAVSGQRVATSEWNYLGGQDRLPTWLIPIVLPTGAVSADYTYDESFDGGSALAFKGTLEPGQRMEFALFKTEISLLQERKAVFFRYLLRNASLLPYLVVHLDNKTSILVNGTPGAGWQQVGEAVPSQSANIERIDIGFLNTSPGPNAVDVVIGEFKILGAGVDTPPNTVTPSRNGDVLSWSAPSGPYTPWYYNVYSLANGKASLVGRTFVQAYDLSKPLLAPTSQDFRVQIVTTTGASMSVL